EVHQHEVALVAQDGEEGALMLFHLLKHRLSFVEDATALAGVHLPPLRPAKAQHLMQHAGTFQGEGHGRHLSRLGTNFGGSGHGLPIVTGSRESVVRVGTPMGRLIPKREDRTKTAEDAADAKGLIWPG